MDHESLIQENSVGAGSARMARGRLLLMVGMVVIFAGAMLLCFRMARTEKPAKTHGLKLIETVVHLPTPSFKTFELLLPCEGTLSIDVTVQNEGKDVISVFMVAPDELAKMKARQTFAHLRGFDSSSTRKYLRSARLAPGRYGLVLMNDFRSGSSSVLDVRVNARLVGLR